VRFEEAVAALDSRGAGRMIPNLSRITAVADMLGEPQLSYPTIHVTGTNGKTTAARVTAAIACAHGWATGLYTSPHLASVTERIAVCGGAISDEDFAAAYEYLSPFLSVVDERGEDPVTYFEALTAMAYTWFADLPVHLGVFEVGMGGSWDATNLVAGDVAVITPISLDHPELGDTVEAKATEKAGIIKPGKIAVVREQPPSAMAIIEARAEEVGATLLLEDRDFGVEERAPGVGGQMLTIRGLHATYEEFFLGMFGEHAALNAGAAVAAMEAFSDQALSEEPLREALAEVRSPGRLEIMGRHPLVLIDGAHNPAGAQALAEALEEAFTWERLHLVIACSADKDVAGIVDPLAPLVARAYTTRYDGPRAMDPDVLARACSAAGIETTGHATLAQALESARAEADDADCILVTGSLFTVAEARRLLGGS
jgi:dihydrofolate synthase / folylpolyglutamate synthase